MNKTQEKQVMHNTVSHPLLMDAQPSVTFCGMEGPFGQLWSAVPAMLPYGFICTSSLAEDETVKSPWFGVSAAEWQPKQKHVINIILVLNPQHSTVSATKNTINFISAITRTGGDADGKFYCGNLISEIAKL